MTTDDDNRKSPFTQTLRLVFDKSPTWGDLIWFVEQVKAAGPDLSQRVEFEWDYDDHNTWPIAINFNTHPNPGQTLDPS